MDVTQGQEDAYAAERAALAELIHKKVNSSAISRSVPYLLGDADRAVTAVVEAGWRPPLNHEELLGAQQRLSTNLAFTAGLAFGVPEDARIDHLRACVEAVLKGAGVQIASQAWNPEGS